jgi:hypothetical protein
MIHKVLHSSVPVSGLAITIETTQPQASDTSDTNKQNMLDVLAELATLLSKVQSTTAQTQALRANANASLSDNLVKSLQNAIQNIQNQIQQAAEAQAHQSFWDKLINWVTAAVGAVLTVCGFPEIGVPMLVMSIANLTGLTDKVADGISSLLQDIGVPKEWADFAAQLIIVVAVTIATFGTSSESTLMNVFKAGAALGMGLSMGHDLLADAYLVVASYDPNASEADKEAMKEKLEMIQGILAACFALTGGIGEAATSWSLGADAVAQVGESTFQKACNAFKNNMSKVTEYFKENSQLFKNFVENLPELANTYKVKTAAGFIQSGSQATQCSSNAYFLSVQAKATAALGTYEAQSQILSSTIKINDTLAQQEQKTFQQRLSGQASAMMSIINAVRVEGNSYAQALLAG